MSDRKIAYATGGDTRRPGAKGLQTRRQIIDVTVKLLGNTRLRDLTVAQIAREAGVSTATFYVYFKDVSDIVLAGLDELSQSTPRLMKLLDSDWSADKAQALSEQVVTEYVNYWWAHRTLFRIRNLAAEEGDERFVLARQAAVRAFLTKVSELVENRQKAGRFRTDLTPLSVAGALTALLERIAAVTGAPDDAQEIRKRRSKKGTIPLTSDLLKSTAHYVALTLSE